MRKNCSLSKSEPPTQSLALQLAVAPTFSAADKEKEIRKLDKGYLRQVSAFVAIKVRFSPYGARRS